MNVLISLIPVLPLLGFLAIALFGRLLPKRAVALTAVGSVTASAVLILIAGVSLLKGHPPGNAYVSSLYTWMSAGGLTAEISLILDPLSLVFCFVITFVGGLIHIYSVEFMDHDEGFSRFFAYLNLFVGSMLILVLADNLLLMYLGWEGVGLCSYLLIGFWYKVPENGYAARKAFIITRIGDTAMLLGMLLLFAGFGTLDIRNLASQLSGSTAPDPRLVTVSGLLLFGGAIGKSAQLPLQTWLPDAMAGPSPVSALIHAATMVTAGVYLVTRLHVLYALTPFVMTLVAVTGAVTLLVAGFSALAQNDLKRVLAYSTISQIGYMFLAMGIGAWSAAIFHFVIHAFFKALLFLSAGAVIHLLNDEHDMFRMGGLYKKMPVVFLTFLAGGASLSALPLVTAGFYSKDPILWLGWSAQSGSLWLWLAGITGALVTSLYTFRMIFITFFGEARTEPSHKPGMLMTLPLVVLALLSLVGGFAEMPENMGGWHGFSRLFQDMLPRPELRAGTGGEVVFQVLAALASLGGLWGAYRLFLKRSMLARRFKNSRIHDFLQSGWGFDGLYNRLIVRPVVWLSEADRADFTDRVYSLIAWLNNRLHGLLSLTQNGRLRWYALTFAAGVAVLLTLMISL